MFIELTPKDWFMMLGLIFSPGGSDPEDAWVRAYLDERQLVSLATGSGGARGTPVRCFTSVSVIWAPPTGIATSLSARY